MPLYLSEDQAMLRDTARDFMAGEGGIAGQLRHWRDKGCKDGFGHALWKQFADMGFTGIRIPEAQGGLGLGHVEAGVVLGEIGRNLTPSPFLVTAGGGGGGARGPPPRGPPVPRPPPRRTVAPPAGGGGGQTPAPG